MQRETFFDGNRWFLLVGMVASCLIPLIVIPVYVDYPAVMSEDGGFIVSTFAESSMVTAPPVEPTFDIMELIPLIYSIGVIFFIGKLITEFISLLLLIKRNKSFKDRSLIYIETESDIAPFSFFNWIVYNPKQFNKNELQLILKHEKVHVKQFHSIDVIISQICCAIFWFNPIMWLYKNTLQQNLEFIADRETQHVAPCEKSYQNLLLKTSISNHQLAFTNNFYNSLIKKRIVMLHKSKSKKMNAYKYALVLPLLVFFVFNFNTEVIAQTKTTEPDNVKIGQNVVKYLITKVTKDTQLESIKQKMADLGVTLEFKNLKRNDQKEIIALRIEYTSDKGSGEFFVNSDEPIKDIAINFNVNENELSVGQATKNLSQSFEIITEDGDKKVKTTESGNNVFVYSTEDDENDHNSEESIVVIGKDGEEHVVKQKKNVYVIKSGTTKTSTDKDDAVFVKKNKKDTVWIKKNVKNIVWTDDEGKDVEIIATENGNENYKIYKDRDGKPLIILDGKEVDNGYLRTIEPNNIDSVTVLKGEKASLKYGKKGNDGVIEIISKNDISNSERSRNFKIIESDEAGPVFIVTPLDTNKTSNSDRLYSIIKTTTDDSLNELKTLMKYDGAYFKFSKVKRNKQGYIVQIKVEIKDAAGKSKMATFKNDEGISTILLGMKSNNIVLSSGE